MSDDLLARIASIEGWLFPPAALLTTHMTKVQDRLGIGGPMLEIGVHMGKFLALLRSLTGEKVVGVQICEPDHAEALAAKIRSNIEEAVGVVDPIAFIMADSSKLSSVDLMQALGAQPRLVHIDGSHEADYVHHDLTITAPILAEGGLMIMDDSYNGSTPGVIEGICRYFFSDARLAPFAQCHNKLFATTRAYHQPYLMAAKDWLIGRAPADVCQRTSARVAANAGVGYVPRLFGAEIAIFL
jgi:hypothetical protein